jgi:hypothetical protein
VHDLLVTLHVYTAQQVVWLRVRCTGLYESDGPGAKVVDLFSTNYRLTDEALSYMNSFGTAI